MPLYEYQCDSCGHRFEVIQKFSDARVEACPSCPGTVRRLLSSPAIQFKGSGWYITDYARKGDSGTSPPANAAGGEKTADSTSTETKADATSSATNAGDAAKKD